MKFRGNKTLAKWLNHSVGLQTKCPGGGGGGEVVLCSLIFSYICRLGSFFGVQNFEFQKNEYFWGYEDFVDIFEDFHIIGLY